MVVNIVLFQNNGSEGLPDETPDFSEQFIAESYDNGQCRFIKTKGISKWVLHVNSNNFEAELRVDKSGICGEETGSLEELLKIKSARMLLKKGKKALRGQGIRFPEGPRGYPDLEILFRSYMKREDIAPENMKVGNYYATIWENPRERGYFEVEVFRMQELFLPSEDHVYYFLHPWAERKEYSIFTFATKGVHIAQFYFDTDSRLIYPGEGSDIGNIKFELGKRRVVKASRREFMLVYDCIPRFLDPTNDTRLY